MVQSIEDEHPSWFGNYTVNTFTDSGRPKLIIPIKAFVFIEHVIILVVYMFHTFYTMLCVLII